jgi:ribosomal protein L21E
MVKLFCVVVGEQGNAFPVDIIVSESVGDLKKAIIVEQKYVLIHS